MTDRVECKLKAKELLRGRWENAVGACLLFFVSTFLLSFLLSPIPIFGWIIIALISTFLTGSFIKYCIKLNETEGKVKYLECLISFKTTLKILACDILIGLVVGIGWIIFTMIFSVAFIASQSIVVIIVVLIILVALGFFIEAILFPVPMILTEDEGVGVMEAMTDIQHEYRQQISASLHIHMNDKYCLEVIIVKGDVIYIRDLTEKLMSLKGVEHVKLTSAGSGELEKVSDEN